MANPNWCQPCGRYHSRDYQDCAARKLEPAAVDYTALNAPVPSEVTDPKYVAGWRAGYEAAEQDWVARS